MTDERDRPIKKALPSEFFLDLGENAEMRWEAMSGQGYLTPVDRFYVRNHGPTPVIDTAGWTLRLEGPGVERGFALGYEELLDLPSASVVCNLECAGNGRVFFDEVQGRVSALPLRRRGSRARWSFPGRRGFRPGSMKSGAARGREAAR